MLEAAMQGSGNPELGSGTGETASTEETETAELEANIQSFGLIGFKQKSQ